MMQREVVVPDCFGDMNTGCSPESRDACKCVYICARFTLQQKKKNNMPWFRKYDELGRADASQR